MLEEIKQSGLAHYKIPDYRSRKDSVQDTRSKRILIIDDNVDIRLSLADILISDGFKVATAKNGLEGLNYLTRHDHPDLILVDLKMPVMDGYDLISKIRESSDLKKIPVIIISGEVDDAKIRSLAMDKLSLLEKPIDFKNFIDIVEKATF